VNVIERIAHLQRVWSMVVPHLPDPSPQDVARWLEHSDRIIEAAMVRTASKFASSRIGANFDVSRAWRYTTSTAKQMAQEEQEN